MPPEDLKYVTVMGMDKKPIEVSISPIESMAINEAAGRPVALVLGELMDRYTMQGKHKIPVVHRTGIMGPNVVPIWVCMYHVGNPDGVIIIDSPYVCVIYYEDSGIAERSLNRFVEDYPNLFK